MKRKQLGIAGRSRFVFGAGLVVPLLGVGVWRAIALSRDRWAAVTALGTVVQSVVVVVAAVLALMQLRQNQKDQHEQTRPYVNVHFELSDDFSRLILSLRNTGLTAASGIKVAVDPPLQSSVVDWHPPRFLEDGVSFLAPGQALSTTYDSIYGRFNASGGVGLQSVHEVVVSYRSLQGELFVDPAVVLDAEMVLGLYYDSKKGPHEIAQELEGLRRDLDRIFLKSNFTVVAKTLLEHRRGLRRIRREGERSRRAFNALRAEEHKDEV